VAFDVFVKALHDHDCVRAFVLSYIPLLGSLAI
jgi:hypothetical protein